jgi:hypothetical protein
VVTGSRNNRTGIRLVPGGSDLRRGPARRHDALTERKRTHRRQQPEPDGEDIRYA